jgi:hypothetical protein
MIEHLPLAGFTDPEPIGIDPASILWLLPLAAAIAVCYKATKVREITAAGFFKEAVVLFGSIVAFIAVAALILLAVAYAMT